MRDQDRTKEQLVNEPTALRECLTELEGLELEREQDEKALRQALSYADAIIETVHEALVVLDADLKVLSVNRSFCDIFQVTPDETIGSSIFDLGDGQWDIPALRKLLEDILPGNTKFDGFEVDHLFPAIGQKIMLLNARRLHEEDGGTQKILLAMEDITARRHGGIELEASETRYRRLFETAQDGILILDADTGHINEVNPFLVDMLGYVRDEVVGKRLWEIGAFKDISASKRAFAELRSKGFVRYEDLPLLAKDGREVRVEFVSNLYAVDHHKVIQCNIRDITKRKRAEEALRLTNERLNLAQTAAGAGVWDWDVLTGHIEWSDQMFSLFGLDPATVTASFDSWGSALHPEDAETAGLRINNALKEKTNLDSDYRVVLPDGQIRWINATGKGEYDDNGNPVRMIGVCVDITDRKRAEEHLRESEEHYRSLFDNMLNGYAYCRMLFGENGPEDFTYLDVNAAFETLTGLGNVTGRNVSEVIPGIRQSSPELFDVYGRVALTGTPERFETYVEGMGMWFSVSVYSPRREHFVAVFDVITERKRAEEALRRAHDQLERRVAERTMELQKAYEKLSEETRGRQIIEAQLRQAQKMEALGTLSGGIAHDFNNILAAIIGFTELVANNVDVGGRDERHLKRIMEASLRGRELVKQMLAFSRKTEQENKPLQLSSIVRETTKLLRASTPTTISIKVNIRSESGLVLGDPTRIQQVLMNLCTNAVCAMQEKGGVLDIDLSDFSVSPSNGNPHGIEPGLYMRLVVSDTGVGIPPEIVDRIFDPFFTTKGVGEGTGLGLSVVMGIVKQSNGYITVESEPGRGSTFSVYFPKVTGETDSDAVGDEDLPTGYERILFVDDEAALVEMGEDVLAELGYEVTSLTSSGEALALLRKDPSRFDLVITDQTMPEMTGMELSREILVLRPDMPIIMCTGFSQVTDADRAEAAGIKVFAMKPLTKSEIARTIKSVLDKKAGTGTHSPS